MFTQSHSKSYESQQSENYYGLGTYKVDVTYDSHFETTNTLTDYNIMQNITNKNKHSSYMYGI